jgi:hypothetical protein
LSLWDIDNSSTGVSAYVVRSNITEGELSSVGIAMTIIGLYRRHFIAFRSDPYDSGWREEILNLINGAAQDHVLSTFIHFATRYNGDIRRS